MWCSFWMPREKLHQTPVHRGWTYVGVTQGRWTRRGEVLPRLRGGNSHIFSQAPKWCCPALKRSNIGFSRKYHMRHHDGNCNKGKERTMQGGMIVRYLDAKWTSPEKIADMLHGSPKNVIFLFKSHIPGTFFYQGPLAPLFMPGPRSVVGLLRGCPFNSHSSKQICMPSVVLCLSKSFFVCYYY